MKHLSLTARKCHNILRLVYLASLIPMLAISHFNYPSADDFSMGVGAYRAFHAHGPVLGLFAAIGQGFYMAFYDWIHWMGYFTSTALMSVPPSVFAENAYRAGTWIILGVFTVSFLYFMKALLGKVCGIDRDVRGCISMLILLIIIQSMPQGLARVESFYWYCSAANYILTFSLGLVYLGLLISYIYEEKTGKRKYKLILSCILGFFTGGGNYMTSLTIAIITVLWMGVILWQKGGKNRKLYWLLLPSALFLLGFFLECIAPGNANRSTALTGFSPVKSILVSFLYTFVYPLNTWTRWEVLVLLMMAAPFLYMAAGQARLSFRYPIVVGTLAFGLTAANITPSMYAEGNMVAGRLQALFWAQYVILLVLFEGYLLGWMRKLIESRYLTIAVEKSGAENGKILGQHVLGYHVSLMMAFLCFVLAFGSVLCVYDDPDYYLWTSAVEDLVNGSAADYASVNAARRQILRDESVQDAVLPAFTSKPDLLFYSDITDNVEDWQNRSVARYYDKNSVVLENE